MVRAIHVEPQPGEAYIKLRSEMRVCWVCKIAIRDRWAIGRAHPDVPESSIARHKHCAPPKKKEEQ